jgi:hypothetical protein
VFRHPAGRLTDTRSVPTVSRFYGIEILMWFKDHNPPHFHARYSGHEAVIAIASGRVLDGGLPPRALKLVRQWLSISQAELERNWLRARSRQPLFPIDPLG